MERELLQLEQEELKRQRNNLAYREQKQQRLVEQLQEQWKSLQDVAQNSIKTTQQYKYYAPATVNYRSSMPNLQFQDASKRRPPPPPVPLTKPRMPDQRQKDVTIKLVIVDYTNCCHAVLNFITIFLLHHIHIKKPTLFIV